MSTGHVRERQERAHSVVRRFFRLHSMLPNQQEPEQDAPDARDDGQIAADLGSRDIVLAIVDARNCEERDIGVQQYCCL